MKEEKCVNRVMKLAFVAVSFVVGAIASKAERIGFDAT